MNPVLVYLLLLKATLTSFSGMASLPMVRNDFVVERHLLTDRQLNTAVVAGRSGPGPNGLYLVSVGYFVSGLPGAAAGLLAVMTPAFLVLPLMTWMSARADSPRRSAQSELALRRRRSRRESESDRRSRRNAYALPRARTASNRAAAPPRLPAC